MQRLQDQKFYIKQNSILKHKLKQYDLQLANQQSKCPNIPNQSSDINFLVVGPYHSGKTQLIKLLSYAISNQQTIKSQCLSNGPLIQHIYTLQNNRKSIIKGVSSLKNISNTMGIHCCEISQKDQNTKNVNIKYQKALQRLGIPEWTKINCLFKDTVHTNKNYSYILICLSIVEKLQRDQISALKTLICELQHNRIKYKIIGTKSNLILPQKANQNHNILSTKYNYIQQWKQYIRKQLGFQDQNCIYCFENRLDQSTQKQANCFYALSLLNKIIGSLQNKKQLNRVRSHNILSFLHTFKF